MCVAGCIRMCVAGCIRMCVAGCIRMCVADCLWMFVLYKVPAEVPLAQAPERIWLGEEANMNKVHSERYWLT
jgi:hypothetical protein